MGENKAECSATSLVEGPALPITGHKLNGQNYPQWVRSVKIFLQGKGKEGYITGDSKSPKKGDPNLNKWQLENSLVMSWLLNTMTNEIGENFMYYDTAKKMWDAVKETYSNVDNTSAVFEIKSILHYLRQGDFSVTEYFNTLSRHWQQLDIYEDTQWSCTEDKKKYKELVEKDRIYKFLLGLNTELDEVRGRILGTKPLKNNPGSIFGSEKGGEQEESDAWKVKPSEAKQTKNLDSRGNTAEVNSNPSPFSKEQMEALQKILQQTISTAAVAQKAESAPNAEPAKTAPATEETAVANAEPAKTAHAAEETAVANAEPAETAPATEETAPTEARERTASEQNQGPATYFRKRRKGVESSTAPRKSHESNQAPENEFSLCNIVSNPELIDDIDIPIAFRKEVFCGSS
ncbi:Gag-polypeptide of LTR copia-type [Sesbania bispinosa]|nr:Gag-polypeptide of LTR copia-type [Sesbania bispinosa]